MVATSVAVSAATFGVLLISGCVGAGTGVGSRSLACATSARDGAAARGVGAASVGLAGERRGWVGSRLPETPEAPPRGGCWEPLRVAIAAMSGLAYAVASAVVVVPRCVVAATVTGWTGAVSVALRRSLDQ